MKFQIYRVIKKDKITQYQKLGETAFLQDAQAILKNWASGYIASGGAIIEAKGMEI